jgi:predicted transposase YbfD/YdcC
MLEVFKTKGRLDPEWQPLITSVARVSRRTWVKDTQSGLWRARKEVAYYACQIPLPAARFAQAVRSHWGIENRAHYVRDQVLGEDDSRIRRKPGMVARLRSFALNILRANGIGNVSQALYRNALSLDHLLAYSVT